MTREEKQKAIDALKISVPIKALTQEEFNDYIQTLNKVMDWLEQEPTTKNNLGVDCIDGKATLDAIIKRLGIKNEAYLLEAERVIYQQILAMPSVTPQEPQTFKWCTNCKEYDQEKHCCHRWSKVIRDTVEEMKQEQEPILDLIREEIKNTYYEMPSNYNHMQRTKFFLQVIKIIDRYKAESEVLEDGNEE